MLFFLFCLSFGHLRTEKSPLRKSAQGKIFLAPKKNFFLCLDHTKKLISSLFLSSLSSFLPSLFLSLSLSSSSSSLRKALSCSTEREENITFARKTLELLSHLRYRKEILSPEKFPSFLFHRKFHQQSLQEVYPKRFSLI